MLFYFLNPSTKDIKDCLDLGNFRDPGGRCRGARRARRGRGDLLRASSSHQPPAGAGAPDGGGRVVDDLPVGRLLQTHLEQAVVGRRGDLELSVAPGDVGLGEEGGERLLAPADLIEERLDLVRLAERLGGRRAWLRGPRRRRCGRRGGCRSRIARSPHPLAPSPIFHPPPAGRGGTPFPFDFKLLGGGAPSPGGGGLGDGRGGRGVRTPREALSIHPSRFSSCVTPARTPAPPGTTGPVGRPVRASCPSSTPRVLCRTGA